MQQKDKGEAMRATDERWNSKLGRLVTRVGSNTFADSLEVNRAAVYQWLRGATAPEPEKAFEIQELARDSGFRISLEDIYHNFRPRVRIKLARRKTEGQSNGISENSVRADG